MAALGGKRTLRQLSIQLWRGEGQPRKGFQRRKLTAPRGLGTDCVKARRSLYPATRPNVSNGWKADIMIVTAQPSADDVMSGVAGCLHEQFRVRILILQLAVRASANAGVRWLRQHPSGAA